MNVYIFVWNYEKKKIKQNVTLCIRTVDISELTCDAGNYVMRIYDLRVETGLNDESNMQKINKWTKIVSWMTLKPFLFSKTAEPGDSSYKKEDIFLSIFKYKNGN